MANSGKVGALVSLAFGALTASGQGWGGSQPRKRSFTAFGSRARLQTRNGSLPEGEAPEILVSSYVPSDAFQLFDEMACAIKANNLPRLEFILLQASKQEIRKASECRVFSPLHLAVEHDRLSCARSLVTANADINQLSNPVGGSRDPTFLDKSPLHVAAKFNRLRMLQFLLSQEGVRVGVKDSNRRTPLQAAIAYESYEVAQYLSIFLTHLQGEKGLVLSRMNLSSETEIFQEVIERQMFYLTQLDLSENSLTSIPHEIYQLVNLTSLNLNVNQISTIPWQIRSLESLRSLSLDHNRIELAPLAIASLPNLTKFNCKKNPLSFLPSHVTSKGNLAILKHLKQVTVETESWKHVKMVLVGTIGSGKSSLCRKLSKAESINTPTVSPLFRNILPESHSFESPLLSRASCAAPKFLRRSSRSISSTDSTPTGKTKEHATRVQITDLVLSNGVRLAVWDTGREEIHSRALQHIITAKAIYLIVLSALEADAIAISFWSQQIRQASHSGRSIAIVVATCVDDPLFTTERRNELVTLLDSFVSQGTIHSYHCVSSRTKIGIPELATSLTDITSDHQLAILRAPLRWHLLNDHCKFLRSDPNSEYLPRNDFISIMRLCKIPKSEQIDVIDLLRDSGRLAYLPTTNEPDLILLQPEWLMKPLQHVTEFLEHKGALLDLSDLPKVWNHLSPATQVSLKSFFIKSEIFFEMRRTPEVLVPSALPEKISRT